MLNSINLTLGQSGDPKLRGVLITSVLATLAVIVALAFGTGWLVEQIGQTGIGWLDEVLPWLAGIGAFFIALLALPGMGQVLSGLFLDGVAEAVEAKHYPDLPAARPQPLREVILESLRFALISLGLNLLVLPLYLIPGLNLVLFYLLNGYLLGREYSEMVAMRRLPPVDAKAFRRSHSGTTFMGGVIIAGLTTVPILNLTTPVLATAFALHEHQRLRHRTNQG